MIDAPAPYVWLAPAPEDGSVLVARAQVSGAEHQRVRAWAAARGVTLVRPARESTPPAPDLAVVEAAVEEALVKARDALAAVDVAALESALSQAENILRDHPELPQSAWLRAEIERGWANRFARAEPRDEARAARAWKRAAALDGGRVAGVGEMAFGNPERVPATLRFQPAPGIEVRVDGRAASPGVVSLAEGEHHVLVRSRGRTVWSDWVGVAKGAVIALPSFADTPCTDEDLARVRASRDRPDAIGAAGVACSRWFVVRGDAIAQCRGSQCGRFVVFDEPIRSGPERPKPDDGSKGAPAWLTWTAVGIGTVLATSAFVYASGIFDKPERETRWVTGGLKTE